MTNQNDDGVGSLRDAIAAAQSGDTISFAVNGTIALTNGELLIDKNLRISGPGATNLAISGSGLSRVIEIVSNTSVSVSGLTICDGHAANGAVGTSNNPAGGDGSDGGGIYNAGSLNMAQCVVSNCAAGSGGSGFVQAPPDADATNWTSGVGGRGGAIYNTGRMSVVGSQFISDSSGAGGNGGGSFSWYGTPASPGGGGGAIYNVGSLVMGQCVISNCVAGNGGNAYASLHFFEFSTNTAPTNWVAGMGGQGGAIYNAGQLSLNNSSLISNASGTGGNGSGNDVGGTRGAAGGGGGAIYNTSVMALRRCLLDYNAAGNGGAGFDYASNNLDGGPGGNGGAVCDLGRMSISDCQFHFNSSGAGGRGGTQASFGAPYSGGAGGPGGGGGAIWSAGALRMNGCTFSFNGTGAGGRGGRGYWMSGAGGGGGPGGAICAMGELNLDQCLCVSNRAGIGGDGGSTYSYASGAGADGGPGGAIFAGAMLRLNGCAFQGNSAGAGGSGGSFGPSSSANPNLGSGGRGGSGGALYCLSDLVAIECTLDSNHAGPAGMGGGGTNDNPGGHVSPSGTNGGDGGAIFGLGKLVLYASTISRNKGGDGSSGGYGSYSVNPVPATSSEPGTPMAQPNFIYWETRGGPGGDGGAGGIYSEGSLSLTLCTVSGNVGGSGGSGGDSWGGFMDGTQGADGGRGGPGGIFSSASNALVLIACTLADNAGGAGGAGGQGSVYYNPFPSTGQGAGGLGEVGGILKTNNGASATIINTIIAGNIGGFGGQSGPSIYSVSTNGAPDLSGAFTSLGYNLIGEFDGGSGFTNGVNDDLVGSTNSPIDAVLGPLADNGGPTLTMALLHGSPALDAGDDALVQGPYRMRTDQRGFARKSGAHVDIGAFEFQFGSARAPRQQPIVSGVMLGNGKAQANAANEIADSGVAAGFQLSFSNSEPGATFTVLATSDLSVPVEKWCVAGQAVQVGEGVFQFTDVEATNGARFYRVSAP